MRIVGRLLGLVVVLLLVVVIGVVGLLASITGRALPQTGGSIQAPGLTASVTVSRDAAGIAQIVADTPHDLFFAQGYVHASERFWQMEVWRHAGAGRLSELFGKSQLDTDTFVRTLGWRQAAQRDLDAASPELRGILQAYADGVNAWLSANHDKLGLAFVVTGALSGQGGGLSGYTPEPWTPLDTATWAKVQAWTLGGNFDSEVFRLLADAKLGDPARTDQLFPAYPAGAPVIVPTGLPGSAGAGVTGPTAPTGTTVSTAATLSPAAIAPTAATAAAATNPDAVAGLRKLAAAAANLARVVGLDTGSGLASSRGIGSNNWVVGPSKSATGHALLANDPHLGSSMPSVWFMNGLHCHVVSAACPYDVTGVSFPGAPMVILGHNARIAWGATNINPDVEDLFIEKVDPADPTHYLFKGQSIAFTTRTETIKVAGGDAVQLVVRETGHGPILNGVNSDLKALPDLYALRWTATAEPDRSLDSFLGLNKAANFDDFRAALSTYGAPAQNFVYADVDGNIGYQAPGLIPIRADKNDHGDQPVSGSDGLHEWTGYIPFNDLPRIENPPSGIINTSNNELVDSTYPYFVGAEWDPGYRAQRVHDLLETAAARGGVTVADMSAVQVDTKILRAALVVPALAEATPATASGRTILDRIQAWDGTCPTTSIGCAAYMAFEEAALRATFDDDLGTTLAREYVGSEFSWQAFIALLAKPTDPFWDDHSTPAVETEPDILTRALDTAATELTTALGTDAGQWTWGNLHQATFREQTLGTSGIGPLEWYFNSGPYAVPGAAGAVNNTYYRFSAVYPDPTDSSYVPTDLKGAFDMTNMPSYRLDIDMGDLDGARIVSTTGQSGNPFDRHYGDLVKPWVNGGQVPLPFTPAAIDRSTVAVLTLTP